MNVERLIGPNFNPVPASGTAQRDTSPALRNDPFVIDSTFHDFPLGHLERQLPGPLGVFHRELVLPEFESQTGVGLV